MTTVPISSPHYKTLPIWLERLSHDEKLELIMWISASLKQDATAQKTSQITQLYGAWANAQTAEELITEIRNARTFNRVRETL